jgi:hypothetical protein
MECMRTGPELIMWSYRMDHVIDVIMVYTVNNGALTW